jgi:hypothetical protein
MPTSSRSVAALTGPSPAPGTAERLPLDMIAVSAVYETRKDVRRGENVVFAFCARDEPAVLHLALRDGLAKF